MHVGDLGQNLPASASISLQNHNPAPVERLNIQRVIL